METSRRIGIRSKIIAGYAIIICSLILIVVLINHQVSDMQKERNFIIDHDINVLQETNEVEKHVLDMVASQRAYLITGDEQYLETYEQAEIGWRTNLASLSTLVGDNPSQVKRIESIHTRIKEWVETTGDPKIEFKKRNQESAINEMFKVDEGRRQIANIRSQLNDFRTIEIDYTHSRAEQLNEQNNLVSRIMYISVLLAFIIAVAMALGVSNSIIRTVGDVTNRIRNITSGGDLSKRIEVKSNDEIKDLAEETNRMLQVMEDRNWLQESTNEVLNKNQGIAYIDVLSNTFIAELARLTNSTYGVMYIQEALNMDEYVKRGAYADSSIGKESFRLGEGLIGQAALEKRMIVIENKNEFNVISSGLIKDGQAKSIMIAPLLFENEVIGVIELASLNEYTVLQQQFVQEVTQSVGMTINGVLGKMEIEKLLSESQAMTEELQAQSEELQTQSEELQMQSEELQMINEQLENRNHEAEEKSAELLKAKSDIEEKANLLEKSSAYKSEFLANMSHELRTPLNSILILSEMLEENSDENLTEEQKEFAKVIHSSGQDLLNLINEILDLSKVEAGKLDIILDEVFVHEIPLYIERHFSHVAEKNGIELEVSADPQLIDVIQTDEKRLNQILKNLLSNAFKFTEKGKVAVTIQNSNQMNKAIEIKISDTGIGIPKEKHELIFEAFQQGEGATVRKFGGTGLGLSICSEFVKLLNGTITLHSEVGKGSTFTLTIPHLEEAFDVDKAMAEAAAAKEMIAAEPEIPVELSEEEALPVESDKNGPFKGKSVLIVDDDYRNIYGLEKALTHQGMNVQTAINGMECLKQLENNEVPDIILMDIMMPEMDGYETMRRLREEYHLTETPIIALTAKAMKKDREECLAAGASDYVSKPLKMDQLLSVMRVWLSE
ncbi:two-component system chemotaxis sensor kinase CheA [Bacillus ectoiniformans]|uniref:ATP-binding protein n=1 Tax=Bacillus ectoiniformans TaxID=1494429 RepID=UPI00195EAE6A|nr:ATP-binding protein [Bacillus ectoiniformans]MBM7648723.1 two-component system chemotaxis sensor kinase CheA [Bacillus ectoiniformans]